MMKWSSYRYHNIMLHDFMDMQVLSSATDHTNYALRDLPVKRQMTFSFVFRSVLLGCDPRSRSDDCGSKVYDSNCSKKKHVIAEATVKSRYKQS